MSAVTAPARPAAAGLERSHLSFGGILKSEWIKLRTLRSTWWCLAIMLALPIGIAFLAALTMPQANTNLGDGFMVSGEMSSWLGIATAGAGFNVFVAAVIGSLVLTGEYGTGMIRSSMAAVPTRIPVLFAKAIVLGVTVFVVSLIAFLSSLAIAAAILQPKGYEFDASSPDVWQSLIGSAGYLALAVVMTMGVGALIRNSAATMSIVLGLLLVVPTLLTLLGALTQSKWPTDVSAFLPSSVGTSMAAPPMSQADIDMYGMSDMLVLQPWQATLVMVGWAVIPLIAGAMAMKRRDV